MKNLYATLFTISRTLASVMLWLTAIIFGIGYVYNVTIEQFSLSIHTLSPLHWQVKHLKMHTSYGILHMKNLSFPESHTIHIEQLSYTAYIAETYLPTVHINDITMDRDPLLSITGNIMDHTFIIHRNNPSTGLWDITIDETAIALSVQKSTITAYQLHHTTPFLSITRHDRGYHGTIDISSFTGYKGHITIDKNTILAHDITTPWGSIEKLSLHNIADLHAMTVTLSGMYSDWLNIPQLIFDRSTEPHILIQSSIGALEASLDENGVWHHSDNSDWHIHTHATQLCLIRNDNHQVCIHPSEKHYLSFKGPFTLNSKPWKGMLAHVALDGQYNGYLSNDPQEKPLHIHLDTLTGNLDHLAVTFFMRIAYPIEHGSIDIVGGLDGLHGEGTLSSSQGTIHINASLLPDNTGLHLHLISDKIHTYDATNALSGAIDLNIGIGSLVSIHGMIDIDEGHLHVTPMAHIDLLHEDVHIQGEDPPIRYALGLDIKIRKRLPISCLGIYGNVGGWLNIKVDSQSEQRINGVIDIDQASFHVYGREITLDDFRIHWLNQPLSHATIDILAHRNIYADISRPLYVQLSVNGQWDNPYVSLTSNQPSVNDIQILSYLFSRAITTNPKDDTAIVEALSANPGQKSLLNLLAMVDGIERGLGLDLFEIHGINQTFDTTLPHQFVIGKLLHPKIMLKYKMSFDSGTRNHITVDYNILPHVSLQIDTDQEDAGVYLLYER